MPVCQRSFRGTGTYVPVISNTQWQCLGGAIDPCLCCAEADTETYAVCNVGTFIGRLRTFRNQWGAGVFLRISTGLWYVQHNRRR